MPPNPPQIHAHWLRRWRLEYRVSFRRPNRKFKVPRHTLEDRLRVFWSNVAKVRQLAQLVLGYDLDIVNMDQSPFHINESGAAPLSLHLRFLALRSSLECLLELN